MSSVSQSGTGRCLTPYKFLMHMYGLMYERRPYSQMSSFPVKKFTERGAMIFQPDFPPSSRTAVFPDYESMAISVQHISSLSEKRLRFFPVGFDSLSMGVRSGFASRTSEIARSASGPLRPSPPVRSSLLRLFHLTLALAKLRQSDHPPSRSHSEKNFPPRSSIRYLDPN